MFACGGVLPNEVRLTAAEEVCRRDDKPLNPDRGKRDTVGLCTVLHDPDTAFAGRRVLPHEVCLAGPKPDFTDSVAGVLRRGCKGRVLAHRPAKP